MGTKNRLPSRVYAAKCPRGHAAAAAVGDVTLLDPDPLHFLEISASLTKECGGISHTPNLRGEVGEEVVIRMSAGCWGGKPGCGRSIPLSADTWCPGQGRALGK
ncbi:hypothetical protein OsJ_24215 [Oryza sativa Japonica Group]|uniref:Uncharacterized protein n=1 Tax=Oryza sativa subsp. japonica TaxID=39947 RepID=A3BJN9_ORYSJ|nr:hypothetical protein OsJ_24215 [Oryza sativa Japonica Group]